LLDLIAVTLPNLDKLSLEVAFAQESYTLCDTMFAPGAVEADSGKSFERRIILDGAGNAKLYDLYEAMTFNQADTVSLITAQWARAGVVWGIERREVLENSSGSKIYDILKTKRIPAMLDMADLLEAKLLGCPADTSDTKTPMGLQYWIPKITSAGAGFYGGVPTSSFSNVGGIIPATSGSNTSSITGGKERWRTYMAGGTGYYTGVIDNTAVDTLDKAYRKVGFRAPKMLKDSPGVPTGKRKILVNTDTAIAMDRRARQQNDNVGFDLVAGSAVFKGIAPEVVVGLDPDTSNPIYLASMNHLKVFALKGDNMREGESMNSRELPDVFTTPVTCSFQMICLNRQRQACINAV